MLQWLLQEGPPGFTAVSERLWSLLHDHVALACTCRPNKPGALPLIKLLLCGEKTLLRRYMAVPSATCHQVERLVKLQADLCTLTVTWLRANTVAAYPFVRSEALSAALLEQIAVACKVLFQDRSEQQQIRSSSSSSSNTTPSTTPATCASAMLEDLELAPDHKTMFLKIFGRLGPEEERKEVQAYAKAIAYANRAVDHDDNNSSSSNSMPEDKRADSDISSCDTNAVIFLQDPGMLLRFQLSLAAAPGVSESLNSSQLILSAAAMQLMLESIALLGFEARRQRFPGWDCLKSQFAHASRAQRNLLIANRGKFLLEVLELAALNRFQQQQQGSGQQAKDEPHPVELLYHLVGAGDEESQVCKEGEQLRDIRTGWLVLRLTQCCKQYPCYCPCTCSAAVSVFMHSL